MIEDGKGEVCPPNDDLQMKRSKLIDGEANIRM
jgi:hypothetical protein